MRDAGTWPEAVTAAIGAALAAAAADPSAAHRLLVPATGRRTDDLPAFVEMVEGLGRCLRHGAPVDLGSQRAARNIVLRIARQVFLALETRPEEPVTAIGPDLIVFALTPYVGVAEARRLADQPIETS